MNKDVVLTKSSVQKHMDKAADVGLRPYVKALFTISMHLYDYRRDNGLTQRDMAKRLNVSQAMVSKLESGQRNISLRELCTIFAKLGKTVQVIEEQETIKVCLDYQEHQIWVSDRSPKLRYQNRIGAFNIKKAAPSWNMQTDVIADNDVVEQIA